MIALANAFAAVIVAGVAEQAAHSREALGSAACIGCSFFRKGKQSSSFARPSLLTDRIYVCPGVVIVPAKRDDALPPRIPLNPDQVTGLENFIGRSSKNALPRILAPHGIRHIGVPLAKVPVFQIGEMAECCEVALLHGLQDLNGIRLCARIRRETIVKIPLRVELDAGALATTIRCATGLVKAIVVFGQPTVFIVLEVLWKQFQTDWHTHLWAAIFGTERPPLNAVLGNARQTRDDVGAWVFGIQRVRPVRIGSLRNALHRGAQQSAEFVA